MILRRYISKETALTTFVVTLLLSLIMLGSRLVRYFALAAEGELSLSAIFYILGMRMFDFWVLIIPLSAFVALMLAFSRLYVEHEMAVLNSTGISASRLMRMNWPFIGGATLLVGCFSLWLGPYGAHASNQRLVAEAIKNASQFIKPKEFTQMGRYTLYVDRASNDRKQLYQLFIHQAPKAGDTAESIIIAESAKLETHTEQQRYVIRFKTGQRYTLNPLSAEYTLIRFNAYQLSIPIEHDTDETTPLDEQNSLTLLKQWDSSAGARGILGFRILIPVMILVAALLTLLLAKVPPRQGRFLRLFPSIILYVSLVVILVALKGKVEKDHLSVWTMFATCTVYIITPLLLLITPSTLRRSLLLREAKHV